MSDLSDFLTSSARFFVKIYLHKKCGVFEACKKVTDFFDTLKRVRIKIRTLFFVYRYGAKVHLNRSAV